MVACRTMSQTASTNGKSNRNTANRHSKFVAMQISGIIVKTIATTSASRVHCLDLIKNPEPKKQALFDNTARAMGDASDFIKSRHIRNCYACDPVYGEGVVAALGMTVADAQAALVPATLHFGKPGVL